jgi:hypothetical protein
MNRQQDRVSLMTSDMQCSDSHDLSNEFPRAANRVPTSVDSKRSQNFQLLTLADSESAHLSHQDQRELHPNTHKRQSV